MKTYRLALIGFGNVGQGFAQILQEDGDKLAQKYDARFQIVAVSDLKKGSLYEPDGLNNAALLNAANKSEGLKQVNAKYKGWDAERTIADSNADVVLEMSFTDLDTGEPATTYIRQALLAGKHVATTNKGPIALHYPQLAQIARNNGLQIGVEGTVMSGTPALRLGSDLLAGSGITQIQGILNGTTNYILSQMERGASYADALADAQAKGYAEADPRGDVEGFDAAGKVVIIANLLMDVPLTMADVERIGISGLTSKDIEAAKNVGERWKLIGTVQKGKNGIRCSVKPQRLSLSHPLANVSGATNAMTFTTDLLGNVTLVGPGAGRVETGYALLGDLLAIHRSIGISAKNLAEGNTDGKQQP